MTRFAAPVALALLLTACGDDPAPAPVQNEGPLSAEGDVLEGSISDEMLPLDSVTSTAPSASGEESDEDEGE